MTEYKITHIFAGVNGAEKARYIGMKLKNEQGWGQRINVDEMQIALEIGAMAKIKQELP